MADSNPAQENGEMLVLLPVDSSDHSLHAFNWYLNHFHRSDHVIGLAHVYTMPINPSSGRRHGDPLAAIICEQYDKDVKEVQQNHANLLKKYQGICAEKGLRNRELCMEKLCSVGETICELAKRNDVCCIVMGQRGLGAIKRTLFGSVSEYVLHNAKTTVVIVPPEEK